MFSGCGGGSGGTTSGGVSVTVSPSQVTLGVGESCQFAATVSGTSNTGVIWSVSPEDGGFITTTGYYTAPYIPGTYCVQATSKANPTKSGQATVIVTAADGVPEKKYEGTITIENKGTVGDLVMNQWAGIEVVLGSAGEPHNHFGTYFEPSLVSARIDDQSGDDPVMTIKGSLSDVPMKVPTW